MSVGGDPFRHKVLEVGVGMLRTKYPAVSLFNILTNPEYRSALKTILEESLAKNKTGDIHIGNLLAEIKLMEAG